MTDVSLLFKMHGKTKSGNQDVYFHNSAIFFTANFAEEKIAALIAGKKLPIGFTSSPRSASHLQEQIYRTVIESLENQEYSRISKAFLRRLGKENILVCEAMTSERFREGLDRLFIPDLQTRFAGKLGISVLVTDAVRQYLVDESSDKHNIVLGMSAVKNVLLEHVEKKLTSLLVKTPEERNIIAGDIVTIDVHERPDGVKELVFTKDRRTILSLDVKAIVDKVPLEEQKDDSDDYFFRRTPAIFPFFGEKDDD